MGKITISIRIDKELHNFLKRNGDSISGQIEEALLLNGFAPCIDKMQNQIKVKQNEIQNLRKGIERQIYNKYLNNAKRRIGEKYSAYVNNCNSKGRCPLAKDKYINLELKKNDVLERVKKITEEELSSFYDKNGHNTQEAVENENL